MLRLYVSYTIPDSRAKNKKNSLAALVKSSVTQLQILDCYSIDAKLDQKQIEKAKTLLANPLIQAAHVGTPQVKKFDFAIEVGFLPGVTDNVGHTAKETLTDGAKIKFKPGQNVYSSQVLFISGNLSSSVIKKIADSLYNPLIQKATITSYVDFKRFGLNTEVPKVKIKSSSKVLKVNLNVADDELIKLGKLGILNSGTRQGPLALSLQELSAIREYFNKQGRQPTDVELEALAQTWSEHCKHTIFADPMDEIKDGIFKHYIKKATDVIRAKAKKERRDFCVSVFTDNAGGISFDSKHLIAYKVETHNTPSALDPFGGAITGIVGVNRDALGFGLGSKPVANFFGFCLADPADNTKLYRDKQLTRSMLSARRIMDGVISGINSGGNQSGIPTPLGFLFFNSRYRGKPLVFAGTLGLLPKKIGNKKSWIKQARPNDLIVMVGGKVGLDGIHGATFSSEGLSTHSPATAVQIGDPITQKKFSDAICKEARDLNLYTSITDCGAGGLSSAIGEMAKESTGCEVYLDKVPVKYPGLSPWQIWISESQERMVLSVPKNKFKKFSELMKSRGVETTAIGKFTNTGNCMVKYANKNVLDIEMEFLHNGRPKTQLTTKKSNALSVKKDKVKDKNLTSYILNLISSLNITSTEFVNRQYDHEVQSSSVQKPLQGKGLVNSEASVIRPVLNSKKGVVLSYGLNPLLSEVNAYHMAATSIDAAIRSAVSTGANVDHLALLDNFCWCSPQDPKRLGQLKEAARACYETAVGFGTPFISGKDSMHNDFKGFDSNGKQLKISIPPTLLITTVGVIPDIEKTVSLDAKIAGDLLYILGSTNKNLTEVDVAKNLKLYRNLYKAIQENLVASSISLNFGGLGAALCKSLIAGGLGAEVNLKTLPGDWKENYQALFNEDAGRLLVSVDPNNAKKFEELMQGNIFSQVGKIIKNNSLIINDKADKQIVKLNLNQALKEYKSTFKDF